jgi:hypothetical protein
MAKDWPLQRYAKTPTKSTMPAAQSIFWSKSIDAHQCSSKHPLCSASVLHELHWQTLSESNIMVV